MNGDDEDHVAVVVAIEAGVLVYLLQLTLQLVDAVSLVGRHTSRLHVNAYTQL